MSMGIYNALKNALGKRSDVPTQAAPQRATYETLAQEDGMPHLFVESPYVTNPTAVVPTELGDVVVRRNYCLLTITGRNGRSEPVGPDTADVAGFYRAELEPMGFLPPSSRGSGRRLRTYEVDPIPADQREAVAAGLNAAGYGGAELNFDLNWGQRLPVTTCGTGIRMTQKQVGQYVADQMDVARRMLAAGRAEAAVKLLITVDRDTSDQSRLNTGFVNSSAYASSRNPDFRELVNRAIGTAYPIPPLPEQPTQES